MIRCGTCGHDVAIPAAVQSLVRNARALAKQRQAQERTLSKVLHQPGARQVVMLEAAIFAVGMGSAAVWATQRVPFVVGTLCFLAAMVLIIVDRRTMADRRAVRTIGRYFGAIAPVRKGAPHTCRSCGAPLPVSEGTAIVACVFCHATNLLDVDLRSAAARGAEVKGDLNSALFTRRVQQIVAFRIGVIALVIFGVPLGLMSLHR